MEKYDFSKYEVKDGKIISKDNPEKFISDDNIDALPLSYKLYGKLIKSKFFNNISNLILTSRENLLFYGFTNEEISEIQKVLQEFLDQYFEEKIIENSEEDIEDSELDDDVHTLNLPYYFDKLFVKLKIKTVNDLIDKMDEVYKVPGYGKTKINMIEKAIGKLECVPIDDDIFSTKNLNISKNARDVLQKHSITDIFQLYENLDTVLNELKRKNKQRFISKLNYYRKQNFNVGLIMSQVTLVDNDLILFNKDCYVYNKEISCLHLNKTIEKALLDNNLRTLYDLMILKENRLYHIEHFGTTKVQKTSNTLHKYLVENSFKDIDKLQYRNAEKIVLESIEKTKFDGITLEDLITQINNLVDEETIKEVVEKNINDNKLFLYDEDKIFYQYPTFAQYLYGMEKGQEKDVLYSRLDGVTLEEIAARYNLTRERIRQVQAKAFKKILFDSQGNQIRFFKEDRFKYIFETYEFCKKDFIETFGVKERTYNYLCMRYNHGHKKRSEAVDDLNIYPRLRTLINKNVHKEYVNINGEYVYMSNRALTEFFVSKYCKDEKHIDDLYDNYKKFIDEYAPDFADSVRDKRVFYNSLDDLTNVIQTVGKMTRYYNYSAYDFDELLNTLNLRSYDGLEISTEMLFNEYSSLMRSYDIRNKYELHNILKRVYAKNPDPKIVFSRMPVIHVGKINRKNYMVSLLREYGELRPGQFADIISEQTGIDKRLIPQDIWLGMMEEFKHNGVYIYDSKFVPFTDEEFDYLNEVLDKSFYTLDEVERIFQRRFPGVDVETKLDSKNMETLGYNMGSKYIVIKPYNAKEYLKTKFVNGIASSESLNEIITISTFGAILQKLTNNLDAIRFSRNGDYISIDRLQSYGVTKKDLIKYIKDVEDFVEDDEYFTIYSLRKHGFVSPLDDLGFDNDFYECLLRSGDTFNCTRFRSGNAFNKTKQVDICTIIETIVNDYEKLEYEELDDILKDKYGIELYKFKIIESIKDSKIYYDSIMDKFYKDYMTYYEEV